MYDGTLDLHVITQARVTHVLKQLTECDGWFDTIRYCDGGHKRHDGTRRLVRGWKKRKDRRLTPGGKPPTKIEYHHRAWDDDYAAQDNLLLSKATPGGWVLIMDDDEIPSGALHSQMRNLIASAIEHGCDMISMPSLLNLDGHLEAPVAAFTGGVMAGVRDPFRKNWLFENNGRVRSFGSPHREVKHRGDRPDAFGDDSYRDDWIVLDAMQPYIHYKTKWEFAWNDVLFSWFDPGSTGFTVAEGRELHGFIPRDKFRTMRELKGWLEDRTQVIPKPLIEWAYRHKDREHDAIRSWYPILELCSGRDAITTALIGHQIPGQLPDSDQDAGREPEVIR
jgi:hypothetical protein